MSKYQKVFFLMAVALMLLPVLALSESLSLAQEESGVRIDGYKRGDGYYLFLPAGLSAEDMTVAFDGEGDLSLDGKPLSPGDRAAGFTEGEHTLSSGKRTYRINVMRSAKIPALFIDTQSGSLNHIHAKKGNSEPGTMTFFSAEGEILYGGALDHVKSRGNASFNFEKKSYQIKLAHATPLCGPDSAKRWILIGNPRDKSLLRNRITLDMARAAGIISTPECASVDLYVNGEYLGNYLLTEKVEINEGRVDIADLEKATEELNDGDLSMYDRVGPRERSDGTGKAYAIPNDPQDITGGYLLEYEAYAARYAQEPSAYGTKKGATVVVKSPEYASEAQMAYISSLIQSFENAIYAQDGVDPDTGRHYTQIADLGSLVRKYLIEEISKNYDGNTSSQFFYKPADSESTLLYAGPAWDYDSAYGAYAREAGMSVLKPTGLYVAASSQKKHWWPALYKQEDFHRETVRVYQETFSPLIAGLLGEADGEGLRSLADYRDEIAASAAMNFVRWPFSTESSKGVKLSPSFEGNVSILEEFIRERRDFLNGEWPDA